MAPAAPAPRVHISLVTKAMAVTSLLLTVAVATGGLLTYQVTSKSVRAQMIAAGKRLVANFAEVNRLELLDDVSGPLNLQLRLKALVDQEDSGFIDSACVLDRTGQVVAGHGAAGLAQLQPAVLQYPMVRLERGALIVGSPIVFDRTVLGYVLFNFNQRGINDAIESILESSALVLAASLGVNILLLALLLRRLLRPIAALGVASREFAQGNYRHRITTRLAGDEVGDAARSFNHMCDELETHLRFSNAALVDRIRKGEATDAGREHQLSVVFGDAVGYTRWSQHHTPVDIFATLRRYYTCMGELMVRRFDGIIDKFMGDGLMAHFGLRQQAGREGYSHVRDALRATVYVQSALRILRRALEIQDREPLTYRFGIASGRCLVGAIGAEDIMLDLSLIGNVVNLASRLEGRAAPGGLLIDRFSLLDVGDGFVDVVDRGCHSFKGLEQPVQVYAVRGFADEGEAKAMQSFLGEELFRGASLARLLLLEDCPPNARAAVERMVVEELSVEAYLPVAASAPPP